MRFCIYLLEKRKDQLLRAPSEGRRNFDASRRGKQGLSLLAIELRGTNRNGEGGEEPAM